MLKTRNILTSKIKLRAKLEAKRIARNGLENAYDQLNYWKKLRKKLHKSRKNVSVIDYKIAQLEEELEKIEESIINMEHGGVIDGGVGFGSGGGSGCDNG